MNMLPLFIGGFGPLELGLILMMLVLLFGASRIPELARAAGLSLGEFEKGRQEVEQEIEAARTAASEDDSQTPDATEANADEEEHEN